MLFGLVCEGPTDQSAIINILCGVFNDDLSQEITELQPGGLTDTNNCEGGWERVLNYISSNKLRKSLAWVDYVIIQIDTDVAHLPNFDTPLLDENGKTIRSVPDIVQKIKDRLISAINLNCNDYYLKVEQKIIFSITVHSLEIWIFQHLNKDKKLVGNINNGEKRLVDSILKHYKNRPDILSELIKKKYKSYQVIKSFDNYDQLTIAFCKADSCTASVDELYRNDKSFRIFKDQLDHVKYEIE